MVHLTLSASCPPTPCTPASLQGLEAAFEKGEVSSWIEFFRRGSLTPLYHDRFPQLSEELRVVLAEGDEAAADLVTALDKVCLSHIGGSRNVP